ncbi:MAG: hypothetical protein A2Z34_05690 [Planctomycetes bacterium RBG_16_59_8]|nr:MAG: hypothetical protein A2Z34_05690 [Planctomycetes bacterium RBG_16_59_8]
MSDDSAEIVYLFSKEYVKDNPVDWENWGKPTFARIFLGLKTGRMTKLHGIIPLKLVYSTVFYTRTSQVGKKYGASFVKQVGHYISVGEETIGDEKKYREPSVQIVLYPSDVENWSDFKKNIFSLSDELVDQFSQESIIVELVRDGVVVGGGKFYYVEKIGDRKGLDEYEKIGEDQAS